MNVIQVVDPKHLKEKDKKTKEKFSELIAKKIKNNSIVKKWYERKENYIYNIV